jgi:hypothetical protein
MKKNKDFIGLSIYRKTSETEEFLPLPPGSLYVDNPKYGIWKTNKKGLTYWSFHKTYKNFPKYLGWGKFKLTKDFHQQMKNSISLNQPFYGLQNEFEGIGTRDAFQGFVVGFGKVVMIFSSKTFPGFEVKFCSVANNAIEV